MKLRIGDKVTFNKLFFKHQHDMLPPFQRIKESDIFTIERFEETNEPMLHLQGLESSWPIIWIEKSGPKYYNFLEKLGTLLLLIFIPIFTVQAGRDNEARAQKESLRAIQSYSSVQDFQKRAIHKAAKRTQGVTGLEYKSLKILGAVGFTAAQGKISTKDVPIRQRIGNATISPLVEHNFNKGKGTQGGVMFKYEF